MQYKSYGLGTTTFSPLAGGLLSGKYSGGAMPENTRFSLEVFKARPSATPCLNVRHSHGLGNHLCDCASQRSHLPSLHCARIRLLP